MILKIKNLVKQVNNALILKNINLEITAGDNLGIKANRQESRILFDLIEESIKSTSGTIERKATFILSDRINDDLYNFLTVAEYIKYFDMIANKRVDIDLLKEQFSLTDCWQTKIEKLSLAQMKRVSLLRMIITKPQLALIESPLTDLDNEGIELYLKCLAIFKEWDIAILYTASYLEELIILCSKVYIATSKGLEEIDVDDEINEVNETNIMDEIQLNIFKVSCKVDDKIILFSPQEIDYIESINSTSQIYVNQECFPSTLTMNELETKLTKFAFYRCHRGYLVNLQRVRELVSFSKNSYTLILSDELKTKIPLSRTKVDEIKQLLEI